MSSLILDSLEIRNFRAFRHLEIERLARINLIVGENNVGKTTLLEALHLYASRGEPTVALNLLAERDEVDGYLPLEASQNGRGENRLLNPAIKQLYYGRRPSLWPRTAMQIGSLHDKSNTLTMFLGLSQKYIDDKRILRLKLVEEEDNEIDLAASPAFAVQIGNNPNMLIFPFESPLRDHVAIKEPIKHVFIPSKGLSNRQLEKLWDKITLTDLEQDVIAALRLIAPQVQQLNFVNRTDGSQERIPKVKVVPTNGKPEAITLRSMGEGMVRLLGIMLALLNVKDGLLLIDEFDSALHHLAQVDVWCMIFDIAHRLNVQIIASSHSWDCIEAYQVATQHNKEVEGVLFSLRNKRGKPGEVAAILVDEEDLDVIVSYPMTEVR